MSSAQLEEYYRRLPQVVADMNRRMAEAGVRPEQTWAEASAGQRGVERLEGETAGEDALTAFAAYEQQRERRRQEADQEADRWLHAAALAYLQHDSHMPTLPEGQQFSMYHDPRERCLVFRLRRLDASVGGAVDRSFRITWNALEQDERRRPRDPLSLDEVRAREYAIDHERLSRAVAPRGTPAPPDLVEQFETLAAAQAASRVNARQTAGAKAQQLFWSKLNPVQRDEFEREQTITVQGSSGGVYRLSTDCTVNNVQKIEPRRRSRRGRQPAPKVLAIYCAAPVGQLPAYDVFLAQKLALETDEPGFLRVANKDPENGDGQVRMVPRRAPWPDLSRMFF